MTEEKYVEAKQYLNTHQLLEKTKKQNLIINDDDFIYYVEKYGYDKLIKGYRFPFGKMDISTNEFVYDKEITLYHILELYHFDFDLRIITFKYISKVEEKIKNQLSNMICENFGTDYKDFLMESNFLIEEKFLETKSKIETDLNRIIAIYEDSSSKGKDPVIINDTIIDCYVNNGGKIPFWAISQITTLGTISKIYKNLVEDKCSIISRQYKLQPSQFVSYVEKLNDFRNVCAHHERLFNHRTLNHMKTRNITKLFNLLGIEFDKNRFSYKNGTKDFLSLIISLKMLLDVDDFVQFCNEISRSINILKLKIPNTSFDKILNSMGLNNDWYNVMAYDR